MNFQEELLNCGGGINHDFITPQLYLHSQFLKNSNCQITLSSGNSCQISKVPSLNISQPRTMKYTSTFEKITEIQMLGQYNTAVSFWGLFPCFVEFVRSIQDDPQYCYSLVEIRESTRSIEVEAFQKRPYNVTQLNEEGIYLFRAESTSSPRVALLYFPLKLGNKLVGSIVECLGDKYFEHAMSEFIRENYNNESNHIMVLGLDKAVKYAEMVRVGEVVNKIQSRPNACVKACNYSFNVDEYTTQHREEVEEREGESSESNQSNFLRATHQYNILEEKRGEHGKMEEQLKEKLFSRVYELEREVDTLQKTHQEEMMHAQLTISLLEKRVQQSTSVASYEKDFARLEATIQNLREHVELLTAANAADGKEKANFKRVVRSLNVDFSNQEAELNAVRRQLRKHANDRMRAAQLDGELRQLRISNGQLAMEVGLLKQEAKEHAQLVDALRDSLQERSSEVTECQHKLKHSDKCLETTLGVLELHSKQDALRIRSELKAQDNQQDHTTTKIDIIEKFRKYMRNDHIRNNHRFVDEQLDYLTAELAARLDKLQKEQDKLSLWRKQLTQSLTDFSDKITLQCGLTSRLSKDFANFLRNVLCQQLD